MKIGLVDIEGNGLLDTVTQLHCAWVWRVDTEDWVGFRPEDMDNLPDYLNTLDIVVAHNGYGYDLPALEKVLGRHVKTSLFDTLVAARLLNPDIMGGHSLKAWGKRLGIAKGSVTGDEVPDEDVDVWEEFTEEMYEYCKDDVRVLRALYQRLLKNYDIEAIDFNPIKWEDWKV